VEYQREIKRGKIKYVDGRADKTWKSEKQQAAGVRTLDRRLHTALLDWRSHKNKL
jgi:hypothetical protein